MATSWIAARVALKGVRDIRSRKSLRESCRRILRRLPSPKSPHPPDPEVPPEAELSALSAGALKRLLASHKVDVVGCVEKADYLEKATGRVGLHDI